MISPTTTSITKTPEARYTYNPASSADKSKTKTGVTPAAGENFRISRLNKARLTELEQSSNSLAHSTAAVGIANTLS